MKSNTDANLDVQALLQTMQLNCLGKNRALPAACYIDYDFLKLEVQKIFRAGWQCLGRADEIPNTGDYFTTEILNEPLIVARTESSKISVLANVCQHRAMQVARGTGNTSQFVCPYHAWTYTLDGNLRSAPLMKKTPELKNCRLPAIRSESWGGFIFATLDETAVWPAVALCELESAIANYQITDMHHVSCFHEVWDCNWKSLVENFMDGYHLSAVHPQSLRPLTPTSLCETLSGNNAYTGYIANYAKAAPVRRNHSKLLTEEQKRQSRLFCIYPSLVVSVSPDTLVYLSMQPQGPEKVRVKWGIASFEVALSVQEKEERIEKWRQINHEDHEILKNLQSGLGSSFYHGGPLAPANLEGAVKDFHDYLIDTIA